jgi:hypothetical protein
LTGQHCIIYFGDPRMVVAMLLGRRLSEVLAPVH